MEATGANLTPPPALRRWSWAWRYIVALSASLLFWGLVVDAEWDRAPWLFWLDLALGVVAAVAYAQHRRAQVAVATLLTVCTALSSLATGPAALAYISMSTRRRWREVAGVGALSVGAGMVWEQVTPVMSDHWYVDLIFNVLFTGIAAAIGLYIGARRELVATLRDRAERAEREQALRVTQARTNERSRIAREMHDVLAHRISLIAMNAGALSYRTDLSRAETASAAEVIRDNAHQALTDLREILGVLRDGDRGTAERPQPTLGDIPALIDDERRAGANIRLSSSVPLEAVPASIGRSAFRMVQESLTNARKHAPDTIVDVELAGESGGTLRVEVRNPLRVGANGSAPPGAGLGLIGLSERADLSGGGLEHFTNERGEFVVRAWLPWPA
jgi:signal transduction histidine kinase